jgi:hypothetical protein
MFAFFALSWGSVIILLLLAAGVVGMIFLVIFLTKQSQPRYGDLDKRDELEQEIAQLRDEVDELKRNQRGASPDDPVGRQRDAGYSE